MTKELSVRVFELERQLADLIALPVILQGRAQLEADRLSRESAEQEEAIAKRKAADELSSLRAFVDADPLIRVVVAGGPGEQFIASLSFPKEKLSTGRFALASPGSSAFGGNWYPQAWLGRASDWAKVVAAAGDVVARAIDGGVLVVHVYPTDEVIADRKLRDGWWRSAVRQ